MKLLKINFEELLKRIHFWRIIKADRQNRIILISAFLIGCLSAIAAIALKNCLHFANYLVLDSSNKILESILLFINPLVGILLCLVFVTWFIKDDISHGVSKILYAISRKNSFLKPHNSYSSIIASSLTIAFGGSVGAEAPIALTGSSIGSNIGRILKLDNKTLTLFIGCGAAGAISGIFKAPIAGIIFTLEVLMLDLTLTSLLPLLISSVSAAILTTFFMGGKVLFSTTVTEPFQIKNILFYVLLGVLAGLFSAYFTRLSLNIENRFSKIKSRIRKLLIGGLLLSILIFIFPSLYGEGYNTLEYILSGHYEKFDLSRYDFFNYINNHALILYLILILFFKVIAMALTNSAGGIGGIFAPSLFCGGILGFVFSKIINISNYFNLSEHNFALVGMAGVMAGVMHSPLTAIFLIAEITGGYGLFIPLITTSVLSFITIRYFERHSIYTKRLALRGELITHDKDKAVLSRLNIDNLIETNFSRVSLDMTLGELVKVVSKSHRNIFPVVDDKDNFLGVVSINDIRDKIFNQSLYDKLKVSEFMFIPSIIIDPDTSMEKIADSVSKSIDYNIPVIKNGKYKGFVSKVKVFSTYRELLKNYYSE